MPLLDNLKKYIIFWGLFHLENPKKPPPPIQSSSSPLLKLSLQIQSPLNSFSSVFFEEEIERSNQFKEGEEKKKEEQRKGQKPKKARDEGGALASPLSSRTKCSADSSIKTPSCSIRISEFEIDSILRCMAGKPLSSPPTVLDILRRLRTLGLCLGLDASAEDSGDKQPSSLFDRILSAFINEVHLNQEIRPIPVFLGGGKAVDLFALYREVFENGGCVSVTKNRLWDAVGERIGFDSDGAGSSVKLVYFKYLDELNRYLGADFCSKERKCSSPDVLDSYKEEDFELKPLSGLEKNDEDGDGDDVVILDPVEVDPQFSWLKKRKRDPLVGMLNWLLLVARNPCDPSIGKITGDDGQGREFAVGALFSQVLMARQAMFHQKKEVRVSSFPPNLTYKLLWSCFYNNITNKLYVSYGVSYLIVCHNIRLYVYMDYL